MPTLKYTPTTEQGLDPEKKAYTMLGELRPGQEIPIRAEDHHSMRIAQQLVDNGGCVWVEDPTDPATHGNELEVEDPAPVAGVVTEPLETPAPEPEPAPEPAPAPEPEPIGNAALEGEPQEPDSPPEPKPAPKKRSHKKAAPKA